jgi:hypothetical protein
LPKVEQLLVVSQETVPQLLETLPQLAPAGQVGGWQTQVVPWQMVPLPHVF